ncbi:MAG: TonB family protein [Pseudomonadota bacterium]|nr:TonB family protein [Pseudomonadota bacterium]
MQITTLNTQIMAHLRDFMADRVLVFCTAAAISLHVFVLFGLSFIAPSGDRALMQDVTIAVTLAEQPDQDADFLAQANQQGAGVTRQVFRLTSPEHRAAPDAQMQQVAPEQQVEQQPEQKAQEARERVLSTSLSWKDAESTEQQAKRDQQSQPNKAARQAAMIASLEAQYDRRKQDYSKKSQIHTVDSVSAKADPSAAYIEGFRRRVEQVGNQHYPTEARARGWSGDVRLMVILKPNGSIRAIRLLETSGHAILDDAARNSVREGAPYDAFHASMKDFSELRIIRTWRFSQDADALAVAR